MLISATLLIPTILLFLITIHLPFGIYLSIKKGLSLFKYLGILLFSIFIASLVSILFLSFTTVFFPTSYYPSFFGPDYYAYSTIIYSGPPVWAYIFGLISFITINILILYLFLKNLTKLKKSDLIIIVVNEVVCVVALLSLLNYIVSNYTVGLT